MADTPIGMSRINVLVIFYYVTGNSYKTLPRSRASRIRAWLAGGIGTEQGNPLRLEILDDAVA
jgi:hypothetical protein